MDNPNQIQNLPSVNDLLKRAWQIFKSRLIVFVGIAILPVIFSSLLPSDFEYASLALLPITVILVVLTIFTSLWASVSLIYAVKEREQKISIKESLAKGWHKIIPYLWISFLAGLIIFGGLILLIIPGIIFAIWYSLANYILVSEDLRGMKALSRSKYLIKGKMGSVVWRYFVMAIIIGIISWTVTFLFNSTAGKVAGEIVNVIISIFSMPFTVIYTFLIYEDLKTIKENI